MKAIAAERALMGLSQTDLAEKIGVTRVTVSRWESGASKPDSIAITAMADLFGCSSDYLLGRTLERVGR